MSGKPILLFLLSIFSIYCSDIAAAAFTVPDLVCRSQRRYLGPYETFVDREIRGLVIIVKFLDDTEDPTYNTAEIDNFFNQTGYNNYGCNGSVKDFFYYVSNGNLILTHDVVGYLTTLKNRSDYEEQSGTSDVISEPIVRQALKDLRDTGYDFSNFSTDSDGNILSINVIYPGKTADPEINTGLWPHAGKLVPDLEVIDDVVFAKRYTFLTLEFHDDDISTLGSVHEIGHALLHLPDLADVELIYGTDSPLATYGNGYYDFMGLGLRSSDGGTPDNPSPPNAYLRYRLGWESVTDITNATPGQTFTIDSNTNTSYRYSHSNGTEYFLIESRTKTERNAALPDEGLMIWHIDESRENAGACATESKTCSRHPEVMIVQADGLYDLENMNNFGDDGDLFHAEGQDYFTRGTTPNTNWYCKDYDSYESGLAIRDISAVGSTMTFTFGRPVVADAGPDQTSNASGIYYLDGNASHDPDIDGSIVSWDWCIDPSGLDSSTCNGGVATGPTPTLTGLSFGNHNITLTVTDDQGKIDTDTMDIKSTMDIMGLCFISTLSIGSTAYMNSLLILMTVLSFSGLCEARKRLKK